MFEVRDPHVQRTVALKLIRSAGASEVACQRFWREAEALAKVHHRCVVRIHELGQVPEGPYITQELIEGVGLDELSQRGALDATAAARILRDLAGAVSAIHAEGILHRDLKPANVIVRPDGLPVLLDFGLARDAQAESLTKTGQIVGTLAYMPPEQLDNKGSGLTPAADVYGLGAILYDLLTGHAPFEADEPLELVGKLLNDDPEWPSTERRETPPYLEAILKKAMAKAPSARYGTARELGDDLERFLAGERPEASYDSRTPFAVVGGAIGIVVVVLVFAITALLLARGGDPPAKVSSRVAPVDVDEPTPPEAPTAPAQEEELNTDEPRRVVKLPRNGRAILFGRGTRALTDLARTPAQLWDLEAGKLLRTFAAPANAIAPAPDGETAFFAAGSTLYRIAWKDGALLEQWRIDAKTRVIAIAPDAKSVAIAGRNADIQLFDLAASSPTGTLSVPPKRVRSMAFTPDGKRLVAALGAGDGNLVDGDNGVSVWDVASGEQLMLSKLGTSVHAVAVSPTGGLAAAGDERGRITVYDLSTLRAAGEFQAAQSSQAPMLGVDKNSPPAHFWSVRGLAFSRGGRLLTSFGVGDIRRSVCTWDVESRSELRRRPLVKKMTARAVSASADGSRLLLMLGKELELWDLPDPSRRRK